VYFDAAIHPHHALERVVELPRELARLRLADEIGPATPPTKSRSPVNNRCGCPGWSAATAMCSKCGRASEKGERQVAEGELFAVVDLVVVVREAGADPVITRTPSDASSCAPETKSAWTWVSMAATIVAPACRAAST
jgi:hypothetical protein